MTRLRAQFPCCGGRVYLSGMRHATDVARRTCPRCQTTWQIVVTPMGPLLGGVAHQLVWSPAQQQPTSD